MRCRTDVGVRSTALFHSTDTVALAQKLHSHRNGNRPAVTSSPDPNRSQPELKWLAGSFFFYGGIAIVVIAILDRSGGAPIRLPGLWYDNRPFWPFVGLSSIVAGFKLLRSQRALRWQPTLPGVRFHSVVFYTRATCPLCDDAKLILKDYSEWLPAVIDVNIDEDPELQEKFTNCVPVVQCDGRVRFRGRINEALLRRLIEGTKPVS